MTYESDFARTEAVLTKARAQAIDWLYHRYRDSTERFFEGLHKPQINQCDGCRANRPLDDHGNHIMGDGAYRDLQGCTRHLYEGVSAEKQELQKNLLRLLRMGAPEVYFELHRAFKEHQDVCQRGKKPLLTIL